MATREQLRAMQTAQPFRPFVIRLNSGRSFLVKHPENAACDQISRSMTVYDDEGMHLVEMFLVEVIEPAESSAPGSQANGP